MTLTACSHTANDLLSRSYSKLQLQLFDDFHCLKGTAILAACLKHTFLTCLLHN